jgi:catechol-2,3-dioxygenase
MGQCFCRGTDTTIILRSIRGRVWEGCLRRWVRRDSTIRPFFIPRVRSWQRHCEECWAAKIPLQGAADHGVSESIYLSDPDENGVELYCDKPKEKWPRTPDGRLEMYTRRLDLHELLNETPEGTEMEGGPRDL